MSESLSDLEKDIEASRARLDRTIDRIQDKLTPVNLVDEMIGSARRTPQLNGFYDEALRAVRRNPLPVLLIAAGVGLLLKGIAAGSGKGELDAASLREDGKDPLPKDPLPPAGAASTLSDPDRP